MFRLIRLIFLLTLGVILGFKIKETQMTSNCAAADGTWTGTICMKADTSK